MHGTSVVVATALVAYLLLATVQCKSLEHAEKEESANAMFCNTATWYNCQQTTVYIPYDKICDKAYDCHYGDDESVEACASKYSS